MSFGFLTPLALIGLGLLAVPILVHIFKPRQVRQIPFSSLRWLRASQHRLSRRIRWHQLLLFLLRALALVALVFALARPFLSRQEHPGATQRFVVVDVSRSMGYEADGQTSPLELARKAAEQIVHQSVGGDQTTILLAGAGVRALGPLAGDAELYLEAMQAAAPSAGDGRITDALRLIAPMIQRDRTEDRVEIHFVTDNHAAAWSPQAVSQFAQQVDLPLAIRVVDVGSEQSVNTWITDGRMLQLPARSRRYLRGSVAMVGHQPRTVDLTLQLPEGPPQSRRVELAPGSVTHVDFELPGARDFAGWVAKLSISPGDGIPGDDTYYVNLDRTAARRVLLIEPPATVVEELQAAFHLRMALDALSFAAPGSLAVQRSPHSEVLVSDIAQADLLVLVEPPSLSDSAVAAIADRVRQGAGLVVFLGPGASPAFINGKLADSLHPSESLLGYRLGEPIQFAQRGSSLPQLTAIQSDHPIFTGLLDPVFGDLQQVQFQGFFQLQPIDGDSSGRVLASIGAQVPAIVDRPVGAGRVLLINTTANDTWSDWPRRQSFVPLMDRILAYLTGMQRQGTFDIGQAIALPLPADAQADPSTLVVTDPDGGTLAPAVQEVAGRSVLMLPPQNQPGVYRVSYEPAGDAVATQAAASSFPFVVQPAIRDSALVRLAEPTLRSWWPADADVQVMRTEAGTGDLDLARDRWLLEPWIMLAACLFLMLEMFFVHYLCPRMNPAVVTGSHVARHGFFKGDEAATPGDQDHTQDRKEDR